MEEPTLIWAARHGKLEMVSSMLSDGKSPNVIWINNGTSALISAIKNDHDVVANLLILSGADLNHKDINGRTAIQYCRKGSDLEQKLLSFGATDRLTLELIEKQERADLEEAMARNREREAREQIAKEEKIKLELIEKQQFKLRFLDKHLITCLYHFTDTRNLQSIMDQDGLLPWSEIKDNVPAPGGNDWSHDADQFKGLDNYIHLCFFPEHPMEFCAKNDGRIIESRFLQIDTRVILWDGVRFCSDVSNKSGVEPLDFEQAIEILDFDIIGISKKYRLDQAEFERKKKALKYEILIPRPIPLSHIKGL
jgi:hypothetical protein